MARGWCCDKDGHRRAALKGWQTRRGNFDQERVRKSLDRLPSDQVYRRLGGTFGAGGSTEFSASEVVGKLLRRAGYKKVSHVTRKTIYLENGKEVATPAWVNRAITEIANNRTPDIHIGDLRQHLS